MYTVCEIMLNTQQIFELYQEVNRVYRKIVDKFLSLRVSPPQEVP